MAYTPHKPPLPETPEQLRARIPFWGVDLDPADRPSVPKLQYQEDLSGAHWELPDQQPETQPRERSIEHASITPVFGTAQPLHGVSGAIRRYAYARFSEGRLAHWLLLVLGDRVDAWGAHLRSFATLRPDNPVTETGVLAEAGAHPVGSRRGRVDVRHQPVDAVLVAGPWVAGVAVAGLGVRRLLRAVRG
jgi:hypothetical protein